VKFQLKYKGGPGSGHRGHSGRPGKRGGSVAGTDGGGLQVVGMGGKPAHIFAEQVVSAQREELEKEALRVGEELWGESSTGLIHQPLGDNKVDAESPSERVELFYLPDDEVLTFPDDGEYMFGYNPSTGKGYILDESKGGIDADTELWGEGITEFYKVNPNMLLVSYGGGDGRVTVWKPE